MTEPVRPADGVAWITGASSGIGRALALTLAARGWRVAVTARRAQDLADLATAAAGRILPYAADVTDGAALAEVAARIRADHGPIALAIANAGVYLPADGAAIGAEVDLYRRSLDVNVMGAVHVLAAVVPDMVARGRGHVALVASVTGYGGLPTAPAYGMTKAALNNLAEGLWFDLAPKGVLVSVVNPGFVDTPATAENPFPMPFLMPVEAAATALADGLAKGRFEIAFPAPMVWLLKTINLLPRALYLRLVARATGWNRR